MPYRSIEALPDSVRSTLPGHAQKIYRKAFNSAWDEYSDPDRRQGGRSREETAHAVAWSAVKQEYAKGADGDWHRKSA